MPNHGVSLSLRRMSFTLAWMVGKEGEGEGLPVAEAGTIAVKRPPATTTGEG